MDELDAALGDMREAETLLPGNKEIVRQIRLTEEQKARAAADARLREAMGKLDTDEGRSAVADAVAAQAAVAENDGSDALNDALAAAERALAKDAGKLDWPRVSGLLASLLALGTRASLAPLVRGRALAMVLRLVSASEENRAALTGRGQKDASALKALMDMAYGGEANEGEEREAAGEEDAARGALVLLARNILAAAVASEAVRVLLHRDADAPRRLTALLGGTAHADRTIAVLQTLCHWFDDASVAPLYDKDLGVRMLRLVDDAAASGRLGLRRAALVFLARMARQTELRRVLGAAARSDAPRWAKAFSVWLEAFADVPADVNDASMVVLGSLMGGAAADVGPLLVENGVVPRAMALVVGDRAPLPVVGQALSLLGYCGETAAARLVADAAHLDAVLDHVDATGETALHLAALRVLVACCRVDLRATLAAMDRQCSLAALVRLLPASAAQVRGATSAVTGNVALCLSECARDADACLVLGRAGTATDAIPRLIAMLQESSREDKAAANAAICLARLAQQSDNLARIKALHGLELMIRMKS